MKKILVSTFLVLIISYKMFSAFYYIPEFGEVYGSGGCGAVNYGNVESIFYNPAGLAGMTKYKELVSSFNKHLYIEGVDINIYNLGYAMPVKFGLVKTKKVDNKYKRYIIPLKFTLGLGIYGMDVNSGLYKENIYLFSIASKIDFRNKKSKNSILYGASLKILSLGYAKDEYTITDTVFSSGYNKTAFTLDIGMIYLIKQSLFFGLNFANILPADVGLKDKEEIKPAINFGLGYKFFMSEILTEVRFRDKVEDYIIGYRHSFFNNKLRFSIGTNTTTGNFSLRYRFKLNSVILEPVYSFSYPYNMQTYGSHNITLKFKF